MAPTTEPKQRSPSIVVQELTHEKIRFALLHTDTSVANALRRVIIAEVPTLAIDLVDVIENTSCLCDEFIAHRLGLIPLLSEKAVEMEFPYDYAGDDESVTDVHFELNTGICASAETVDVTSNDLVCYDPRVAPVNYHPGESIKGKGGAMEFEAQAAARGPDDGPDIPGVVIVKLRRGQQINMRCVARKGVGRDHAKWQPVATATYRFEPEITINEELMATLTEEEKMAFVESSPTALFRYDEATRRVVVDAPDQYGYDGECLKKAEELGKPGLVDIRAKEDAFHFTVESTGALRPEEIVVNALKVLERKMEVTRGELDILEREQDEQVAM